MRKASWGEEGQRTSGIERSNEQNKSKSVVILQPSVCQLLKPGTAWRPGSNLVNPEE